jgi:integrase
LRWSDIDLDASTITIAGQIARDGRSWLDYGKTDDAQRTIPALPALRRRLLAHRLASPWTQPTHYVFAVKADRPKEYRNVRRALDMARESAGIDGNLTSHDFRRTHASHLIVAERLDDGAVTGVLGHASIDVTRRLYAADWRDAQERNAIVLRQLAEAGIGQELRNLPESCPGPATVVSPKTKAPDLRGLFRWSVPGSNR